MGCCTNVCLFTVQRSNVCICKNFCTSKCGHPPINHDKTTEIVFIHHRALYFLMPTAVGRIKWLYSVKLNRDHVMEISRLSSGESLVCERDNLIRYVR